MSESQQGTAKNRKKPRGKPFPPGNNANPGGRPKLPEDVKHVRELARQYTEDAVSALVEAMQTGSGPARVSAANSLLDRGWGRPTQDLDVNVNANVNVTRRLNVSFD